MSRNNMAGSANNAPLGEVRRPLGGVSKSDGPSLLKPTYMSGSNNSSSGFGSRSSGKKYLQFKRI